MKLELKGYPPSQRGSEMNPFIRVANLQDRWWRSPVSTVRAKSHELLQIFATKDELAEHPKPVHKGSFTIRKHFTKTHPHPMLSELPFKPHLQPVTPHRGAGSISGFLSRHHPIRRSSRTSQGRSTPPGRVHHQPGRARWHDVRAARTFKTTHSFRVFGPRNPRLLALGVNGLFSLARWQPGFKLDLPPMTATFAGSPRGRSSLAKAASKYYNVIGSAGKR